MERDKIIEKLRSKESCTVNLIMKDKSEKPCAIDKVINDNEFRIITSEGLFHFKKVEDKSSNYYQVLKVEDIEDII